MNASQLIIFSQQKPFKLRKRKKRGGFSHVSHNLAGISDADKQDIFIAQARNFTDKQLETLYIIPPCINYIPYVTKI
jgi:hypothetical protein